MANFCQSVLSQLDAGKEHNGTQSITESSTNNSCDPRASCAASSLAMFFMITFTLLLCLFGFVGNGTVIWLLAFRIKRNHFTTYVLNLSFADFGVLTAVVAIDLNWVVCKSHFELLRSLFYTGFLFTYSASQLLLTVISIGRFVCIFFPIWYRFHKHKHLSVIVCTAIWILAFVTSGIHITLWLTGKYCNLSSYQFLVIALLCTLLMSLSTVTLSWKIYLKPHECKRGKLIMAILLTLLFFLLLAIPMDAVQYLNLFHKNPYLLEYAFICASLNSTINPAIYFLVGRKKSHHSRERIKSILENVLKEEGDSKGE
ncbi:mas-related G-protein coupled receptor member H-like [Podarcis lilfordi]|uniref:Mas-related G-protein coupled receptor member H-like n=1 Tax=Podarcis lilfordi TaxID=74358 RepID=A0AA35KIK1_9SAUR|nr:mas-related G-protein coupled receptor member H-like [Podarcis lilfordi]